MQPMRTELPVIVAVVALIAFAAGPAGAMPSVQGDPVAGRRLAEEFGCNTCHGVMTDSDIPAPHIAGQKKDYLVRQMESFREQRAKIRGPYKLVERDHPLMSSLARPLSDANVQNLAEYFAGLPCVPRRAFAETQVPRRPLADRCAFCHGETGVNPYPGYPNIGGQKKAYLVLQLRAFRESSGHANTVISKKDDRFHRTMAPSLYDLKDDEIEALAEYYSKQSCR